ncbi:DNA primase family protein [Lysinibacillus fusiformis]|uniref:Putative DNA primase/helicase n=1 Tax=Lysinibacillus fusiformis TaxID=28031 RepID=A0A1H9KYC3_9BACI|nr:DNA primase family protein [Lysinibacillus fusiformis]SCY52671.1 putative DNA primase/helicase [Lysinibacillus fusiformis]SEN93570.1 putative DNA primase/helicase [Lysinibacillus fusiformis]SER04156.1 putative DNA primase/helicase [Lysinibacillus fusiformis]
MLKYIDLIQDKNSEKYAYSKGTYHRLSDNEFKQVLSNFLHEQKTVKWRKSYKNEYLDVMTNIIPIRENTLNPSKKISLQNGYYDLESRKFYHHNKNVFFFSQLGFKYDANAKCPQFQQFLSEVFEADQERVQLIQEILGYILWDEMHAHKYFVFLGNGANGKSVLARIMTLLYGEQHISSTPLKKLETPFGLQDLAGKWLNLAAENEQSHEINSEVLKGLATGDPLLVNKKYRDPSTEVLRTKLVLIMNNMFRTLDKTEGFYRRLIIVPFEATFVEYPGGAKCDNTLYRDPELFEKIAPEISGIFNFALQGLERLRRNNWNFTSSKNCEAAKKRYRVDTSPEEAFFERHLEYQHGHSIGKAEVTNRYRNWIATNDIDNGVTARNINKKLDAYAAVKNWSIERYKNNTDRIRNLKWKDDSNGYNG